jgi:hypothetical protein
MDFGAMMGGDWGGGFAQGMQMAMAEKQMAMQQQRMKQEERRNRMLMEEHGLKLKKQRELDDASAKIKQMFLPKMETRTGTATPDVAVEEGFNDTGMENTPLESVSTAMQDSKLIQAIRAKHGDDFANVIQAMAQVDPMGALKASLTEPKNTLIGVPEGGLYDRAKGQMVVPGKQKPPSTEAQILSLPDDDPLKKNLISGKGQIRTTDQKAPSGYRYTTNGDLEPIPNGPADVKRQNAASQAFASLNSANENLNRLGQAANSLMNHPGLSRITGIMSKLPNMPGSAAANAQALLDNLKSQAGFTVLQNMRDMSKTGGALGQVSDFENKMLQANLAALDSAQSLPEFKKALKQIINFTEKSKANLWNAYDQSYYGKRTPSTPEAKAPVSGARQAPDGKWYVPDPNRPGKYMQVVE